MPQCCSVILLITFCYIPFRHCVSFWPQPCIYILIASNLFTYCSLHQGSRFTLGSFVFFFSYNRIMLYLLFLSILTKHKFTNFFLYSVSLVAVFLVPFFALSVMIMSLIHQASSLAHLYFVNPFLVPSP